MGKVKERKATSSAIDTEREQEREEILAEIEVGVDIARRVFGAASPSTEMIFGCVDRVYSLEEDDHEQAIDDLLAAAEHSRRIFDHAGPDEVFGIYDRAFGEDEDGEDEDDEDDEDEAST